MVNVKAIDGEIVQQNFFADPEKDYVTIDFKNNQGRFVTVHIDFRLVSFPLLYRGWLNCNDQSWDWVNEKYYFQSRHTLIKEKVNCKPRVEKLRKLNISFSIEDYS